MKKIKPGYNSPDSAIGHHLMLGNKIKIKLSSISDKIISDFFISQFEKYNIENVFKNGLLTDDQNIWIGDNTETHHGLSINILSTEKYYDIYKDVGDKLVKELDVFRCIVMSNPLIRKGYFEIII